MSIHPTTHWHAVGADRVQCDVCPQACKLKQGQRGTCSVRENQGGAVVSTTYGLTSGLASDPVEKKPLYHFLPGTSILSFGTAGCNLTCAFCQNWDLSRAKDVQAVSVEASPREIARAAKAGGCESVAFTYNDPIVFLEYAMDTAKEARALGLKTVAVTSGYMLPEARKDFYRHMDAANVDLKAFTDSYYRKFCGGSLKPVLDTLVYIRKETPVWLEITNLLLPGENDSEKEVRELCQWVLEKLGPEVPLHFSAFHPAYKVQDRPPTRPENLFMARKAALGLGLKHVYTGNVRDPEGSTTFCGQCGKPLIVRDWFEVTENRLKPGGLCGFCGARCAGVF
jgi:pyruvate formate lyase activating enzyme